MVEPISTSFAFSHHNTCGEEGVLGFVATRVDSPQIQSWIATTISPYPLPDLATSTLPTTPPVPDAEL